MNQLTAGLIVALIVVALVTLMWLAWRRRNKRDALVLPAVAAFIGSPSASFERVFYVATTPEGEPLARVAAPGLAYRGYADIDLFAGGLELRLPGEAPVRIPADLIVGSGTAQTRIDKVVEADGLVLVRWYSGDRVLESSFRFPDATGQRTFASAIDSLAQANPHTSHSADTTQEA